MKTRNIIQIIIIVALILGIGMFIRQPYISKQASKTSGHHALYYCPMHPQILYDHPGRCPICGMDLVKKVDAPQQEMSLVEGYTTISETAQKEQLIGLRTQVLKKHPMVESIRTFGTISSADDLYKVQSEFIDAYTDFVTVFRDYKNIRDRRSTWKSYRDLQIRLLESKDKLLKLGLSEKEIAKLQKVSWSEIWKQPELLMFNDRRSYWVMAQIFEEDYQYVHEGQEVVVNVPAYQLKIKGIIRSVGGFIDPVTRSVTALIELEKNGQELAANMQLDITIPVNLGNGLLVPREAVMDTGLRKIVFISKIGNSFEPREIQTGAETDDGYEIKSGLKEGERIVVSGNFLLDSESRIQASLEQGASHGE